MALFGLFRKKKDETDVPEGPGGSENLVESDTQDIQDAISSEIKQEEAVKEFEEEEQEEENADSVNVTGSLQGSIREAVFEEISSNEDGTEEKEPEVEEELENDEMYMDTMQDDIQEAVATEVEKSEGKEKKGFFKRLVSGLTKTRDNIANGIDSIFSSFTKIDEDFYEELEEVLVMADIGIHATTEILEQLRKRVKEEKIKDVAECKQILIDSIKEQMHVEKNAYDFEDKKSVVLFIGVNGVGKTTSIGKLSSQLKKKGKKVLVAAADTFRAAAIEQLEEWTNRAGVDIIAQQEGSDPAAVVFDALASAKAKGTDILLVDTAGRLHNKKNLMEELKKINRIIDREYPDAYRETFIVLDGTTGQNAMAQAKQFSEVADITGIILTKLDGTAKGGIAIAIQSELKIPVKYIGIGEKIDDLQKFNADDFVEALFEVEE
ncbi:signal recognition particle receptor FtsY [Clostridium sp. CAG:411]|jgi:fused signal recognition particle receptor|nr:signal recognition particle receptor FtsY [Clostridium sp. CAG:411]